MLPLALFCTCVGVDNVSFYASCERCVVFASATDLLLWVKLFILPTFSVLCTATAKFSHSGVCSTSVHRVRQSRACRLCAHPEGANVVSLWNIHGLRAESDRAVDKHSQAFLHSAAVKSPYLYSFSMPLQSCYWLKVQRCNHLLWCIWEI